MKFLIFGSEGWIGQQACKILEEQEETVIQAKSRADNEKEVLKELDEIKPDRVISFIGRTHGEGYSTIDYLEQKGKLVENIRDNLYSPLTLAFLCKERGIHFSYLGTGCVFSRNNGEGYSEEDLPDFFSSSYSTVKGFTDRLMHFFEDSVLNCRIRMPIVAEKHPRNFITKIMTYEKICSIPNSMTVLPELLPIMINMSKKKITGTINLTNPGMISHNEILEMVKEIYDPNFTWKNFTLEEQSKILLSGRSNNLLNTEKLEKMYPNVLPIKESVRKIVQEMAKSL
jgi:dTDP-4-dehydrorhamnose reductase